MNSREKILNRLRKAKFDEKKSTQTEFSDSDIFADYPSSGSLLEIFTKKFQALGGELIFVSDLNKAGAAVHNIILESSTKKCLIYSSPLIDKFIKQNQQISTDFDWLQSGLLNSKLFSEYEMGLTTADFLVSRSGSIVLRSISAGGRRLSVLPPTHIVLAEKNQVVYSLDQVYKDQCIKEDACSFATVITGPSRTSDIEKQLVLGAHGPKRLIIILIDDDVK